MSKEIIKEVFSNKEFVKTLMEMVTPEEVEAALKEKNIEFSTEDIKKITSILQKEKSVELSDEELENIAGGTIIPTNTGIPIR